MKLAIIYDEKEVAANELTDDARHILRNLLDQLSEELSELDERGVNPGPWHDPEGVFFDHGGETHGPFATEDEAEAALAEAQLLSGRAI